jgi:CheY-like chemotaxis protein
MPYALVIEDDSTSAQVLSALLQMSQVDYTLVYNSDDVGDALAQAGAVDVIFIDLELPGRFNGLDLAQLLHEDARFANIPTVAYTAHLNAMNEARAAGFHSFLGKPLRSAEFKVQLQRILNGEAVWEVR